jgi:transposase
MSDVQYPTPGHLPTVLSIDEFRGNAGGQKFQAILTDAANHKLFDILPSRSQVSLMTYFQQFKNRNQVRYFVMDMNRVYRDLALSYFPNATIVIDRFHVVRYVTWALENIRKRIQKQMHPSKRKYFKRSRRILLAHQNKLNPENLDALEIMLMQSNDLAVAYHLKELFYEFMASENRVEAGKRLHTFVLAAQVSQLNEFKPCLTMLGNWSKYILNSFDCPYNNGYTEGTNNTIKVIKRNAYGYRNFNNFRNRIFLSLAK